MVDIEHVSLTINKNPILKNICLSVEQGEIVGFIGPNGSGKTMLMKCICGLNNRFTGKITVNGLLIGRETDFAPDTGFIIETPSFIPYYSGYQNLRLLAMVKHCIGEDEIVHAMELVGLDPGAKKMVKNYSLGMKQRLGIAQAIMENPRILILDEPMNGLDENGVGDIRSMLLRRKQEGNTIILASHSMEDIKILCDRIYRFRQGCVDLADDI